MIRRIEVKNYRMFYDVTIDGLSGVNLFAGKNNIGKSSLLELIFLHNNKFSQDAIYKVLLEREELLFRDMKSNSINPIRHLFYNHLKDLSCSKLSIKSNLNETTIEVGKSLKINALNDNLQNLKTRFVTENEDMAFIITSKENEMPEQRTDIPYYSIFSDPLDYVRYRSRRINNNTNTLNIPSYCVTFDSLALLWDKISLSNYEKHIIEALRIIDKRVCNIGMIQQSPDSSRRIPIVKLDGSDEVLTLKSLGDGMGRIFQIILSLVNCKDGVLLIDEFENGLHWSIQEKVWSLIFELSEKLNVQIFITTHSKDCLSSFAKVWKENEKNGYFFRMESKNNNISIKNYDLEKLSDSLRFDAEVR